MHRDQINQVLGKQIFYFDIIVEDILKCSASKGWDLQVSRIFVCHIWATYLCKSCHRLSFHVIAFSSFKKQFRKFSVLVSRLFIQVSQEKCARLQEGVPYVKVCRYNPKHLCPKLNGYGDNGQRSLKLWQVLHTCWLPNTY
jgi:hypothetical protein